MRPFSRTAVAQAALAVLFAASHAAIAAPAAPAAAAQANDDQEMVNLDIPAQPLGAALAVFAQQAQIKFSNLRAYAANPAMAANAPALKGKLPLEQALDQLLAGSGLQFDISGRTGDFFLMPAGDAGGSIAPAVAVAAPAAPAAVPASAGAASAPAVAASGAVTTAATSTVSEGEGGAQRVTVTGTRLKNVQPASPMKIIDAEEMQRSGFTNVEDVFRRLSISGPGTSSSTVDTGEREYGAGGGSGASYNRGPKSHLGSSSINLRGLGSRGTLILINGRRKAGSAQSAGDFTDISSIPIEDIERIEILTDGASAIYGADAVAGVVNIILKKQYDDSSVGFRQEWAQSKGNVTRANFSTTFKSDNGFLSISGSHERSRPDDPSRFIPVGPQGQGDLRDIGGNNNRMQWVGSPGPIFSAVNTDPLFGAFEPGQIIGVPPAGQNGQNLTIGNLIPLSPTSPVMSYYEPQLLGAATRSDNIRFSGEYTIDEQYAVLTYELAAGRQANDNRWQPTRSTYQFLTTPPSLTGSLEQQMLGNLAFVPANNKYNQFGVPVYSGYSFQKEFSLMNRTQNERQSNLDMALGLSGRIGGTSSWDYELGVSRSKEHSTGMGWEGNDNPSVTPKVQANMNFFSDGSDPAVVANNIKQLEAALYERANDDRSWTDSFTAKATGELFEAWAGPVQLAVGGELRREKYALWQTMEQGKATTVDFPASRRVDALYGEMYVPVAKDADFAKSLGVSLAARWERSSQDGKTRALNNACGYGGPDLLSISALDFQSILGVPLGKCNKYGDPAAYQATFSAVSPSLGLVWKMNDEFTLKSSMGRSFQAPAVRDLYGEMSATDITKDFISPGSTFVPPPGVKYVGYFDGANYKLKAQYARTFSLTAEWSPTSLVEDLTLKASYVDTNYSNFISTINADNTPYEELVKNYQTLLDNGLAHMNNGVLFLDARNINFAARRSRALDFGATYFMSTDWGDFNFGVDGTYTLSLTSQAIGAFPVIDIAGTDVGPSRWKTTLSAGWGWEDYYASAFFTYSAARRILYPYSQYYASAPDSSIKPATEVAPWYQVDVQFGYRPQVEEGWLKGLDIAVGVQNLFAKRPPPSDSNKMGFYGGDGGTRGRVIYLNVTKKF